MKIFFLGTCGLLWGCFEAGSGPSRETAGSGAGPWSGSIAARYTSDTHKYFVQHHEFQTGGGSAVERFKDCDENGVLVGFGGRVDGSSNFTDLTVHCRNITPFGDLGPVYTRNVGGSSQESYVVADPGYVVVSVGGRVSNENLDMAHIRQCLWDSDLRAISPGNCSEKKGGNTSATDEMHYPSLSEEPDEHTVLTGVGLTASSSNLAAIRYTRGSLRTTVIDQTVSSLALGAGQDLYYSFQVPSGQKWTGFRTMGGTGNLDLYIKKGSIPLLATDSTSPSYDCGSANPSNNDACEVTSEGTYYILLHAVSAVSGASYQVRHGI